MDRRIKKAEELESLAKTIVLFYLQSWGQGVKKQAETLNIACKYVGIDVEFVQDKRGAGWLAKDEETAQIAKEFKNELEKCWPLGQFELEQAAVVAVLNKWKKKAKGRWQWVK